MGCSHKHLLRLWLPSLHVSAHWQDGGSCLAVQMAAPLASLRGAWATLLNALNAADLALHGAYAAVLALLVWRQAQPLAARVALLAGETHPCRQRAGPCPV